jgi:hypothetical protein
MRADKVKRFRKAPEQIKSPKSEKEKDNRRGDRTAKENKARKHIAEATKAFAPEMQSAELKKTCLHGR